mmetsp:Transcript_73883/g.196845  ORF Transcript_73883/g.196845 Transcript_73883/m.196845 type:complete len:198 (-) Transcript_73883:17-610(-)
MRANFMYWSMSTIPRFNIFDWAARIWAEEAGVLLERAEELDRSEKQKLADALQRGAELFVALGSVRFRCQGGEEVNILDDGIQYRDALATVRRWTQEVPVSNMALYSSEGWIQMLRRTLGRQPHHPADLLLVPLPSVIGVMQRPRSYVARHMSMPRGTSISGLPARLDGNSCVEMGGGTRTASSATSAASGFGLVLD